MRAIGLALGALLLLPTAQAMADCDRSSLEGSWRYFSLNVIEDPEGGPTVGAVEDCDFRINHKGVIVRANCDDDDFDGNEDEFKNVAMHISRSCEVEIETYACSYRGQIENDTDGATAVSGVSYCALIDRLYWEMVKR